MYPHVQRKAQAELDRVVGEERLPSFDDYQALPYVQAIVLETLRWMPALPMGNGHRVLVDDEYKGYHIPKESLIIPVSLHCFVAVSPNDIIYRIYGMKGRW